MFLSIYLFIIIPSLAIAILAELVLVHHRQSWLDVVLTVGISSTYLGMAATLGFTKVRCFIHLYLSISIHLIYLYVDQSSHPLILRSSSFAGNLVVSLPHSPLRSILLLSIWSVHIGLLCIISPHRKNANQAYPSIDW